MVEAWLVALALALPLALALTLWLRRPRLDVELSLRGGTRAGVLYAVVHNRGHLPATRVRARLAWRGEAGEALIVDQDLGRLAAHDAVRIEARNLQRALGERRDGWTHLAAHVRARYALPARATLALQGRDVAGDAPAVQYERAGACPASQDGRHRMERQDFPNDGVMERWQVCRLCRHVERLPLTPEEAATQARIRAARAERERRAMEEEFARAEREPRAPPPPRRERAPPEEPGDLPLSVAYWVLGLDERATWDDVLAAHRRLAMEHHPDRAASADARVKGVLEARMQEINRARDRLREHLLE